MSRLQTNYFLFPYHGSKLQRFENAQDKMLDIDLEIVDTLRKRMKNAGYVLPRKIMYISRTTRRIICYLL